MRIRTFILVLVVGAFVGACGGPSAPSEGEDEDYFFFVSADPQINVPEKGLAGLDSMVAIMNATPGTTWPFGGRVEPPRGTLIPGDLVDDLSNRANWQAYQRYYDPRGEAKLRFPVFAGIGNHDLSDSTEQTFSYVERAHIERNKQRQADLNYGPNGYHYSWDWDGIHFVSLNVFPGNEPRPVYGNPAPWNDPKDALAFLKQDLSRQVESRDQPVILFWHYGLRGWGLEKWWAEADLKNLESVLAGYNVVLILHGHEHRYERYEWAGYDVIMAPAPVRGVEDGEMKTRPKGFLAIRVTQDSLQVAHHGATTWQETWSKPLRAKTKPAEESAAPAVPVEH